jgi:hypothetical protein
VREEGRRWLTYEIDDVEMADGAFVTRDISLWRSMEEDPRGTVREGGGGRGTSRKDAICRDLGEAASCDELSLWRHQ